MGYIEISDVRNAGIDASELSDSDAQNLIDYYSDYVDRATGQWFESRSLDFSVDGNGTNLILFMVPIIDISAIYINELTTALDSSYYKVYNRSYPDDRKNPKIKLQKGYTFNKGDQNQRIVGNFGFVEIGGTPPLAIQKAVLMLVVENRYPVGDEDAGGAGQSYRVIKEVTDGHSITYGSVPTIDGDSTGIPEVDKILKDFKRPRRLRMSS